MPSPEPIRVKSAPPTAHRVTPSAAPAIGVAVTADPGDGLSAHAGQLCCEPLPLGMPARPAWIESPARATDTGPAFLEPSDVSPSVPRLLIQG